MSSLHSKVNLLTPGAPLPCSPLKEQLFSLPQLLASVTRGGWVVPLSSPLLPDHVRSPGRFSELTALLAFHPSAAWSLLSPCVELSISVQRFFLTNASGWVVVVMGPSSFMLPAILLPLPEAIRLILTSFSGGSIYSGAWNWGFIFLFITYLQLS